MFALIYLFFKPGHLSSPALGYWDSWFWNFQTLKFIPVAPFFSPFSILQAGLGTSPLATLILRPLDLD